MPPPKRAVTTATDRTEEAVVPPALVSAGVITHHCSQCNRTTAHQAFEDEDGLLLKCPCGWGFVDIGRSSE